MKGKLASTVTMVLVLGFGGATLAQKPAATDQEKLQGVWYWVSAEVGGMKRPDPNGDLKAQKVQSLFMGDNFIMVGDKDGLSKATYRLDPSKNPKEFDLTVMQQTITATCKGIYRFEGDDLTLCYAVPGGERPKEFVSKKGANTTVIVLKRKKP